MQIAYFDCFSGISGDMTLAALIDAGADLFTIQAAIDSMDLPGVRLSVSNTSKRGFRGKLLSIEHPKEHAHRFLRDIHQLIRRARISTNAKDLAMRFFERIARSEAKVHGTTIDRVQFHEVGAVDSIVDMVGVAVAWDSLQIDRAYASPIPTGAGQIQIAHGTVSVPAPATVDLLLGVPIAPSQIPLEMTTPTGAAIVTELATEFGPMPPMQVGRIGYGAGRRDMPDRPNLLRILIGTSLQHRDPRSRSDDSIVVIECNLDDVTGEQIGFAIDRLWNAGALDVFTSPIQMKKNRPGTLLTILAKPSDRSVMESILFQQTGTLGVRYRKQSRTVLPRASIDVQTPWGIVTGKVSKLPTGEVDFSPEYDECSAIAAELGLRLVDVVEEVRECYHVSQSQSMDQAAVLSEPPPEDDLEANGLDVKDSIEIESVNAVFRQAAFEDEFGDSTQPPSTRMEESTTLDLDQSFDRLTPAIPRSESLDRIEPIDVSIDISDTNEYYRWDSSPWTGAGTQAIPPAKTHDVDLDGLD
jgi:pyridinium-3,5-bisthiocarboxylic acid mononucleotide nickel chelatase